MKELTDQLANQLFVELTLAGASELATLQGVTLDLAPTEDRTNAVQIFGGFIKRRTVYGKKYRGFSDKRIERNIPFPGSIGEETKLATTYGFILYLFVTGFPPIHREIGFNKPSLPIIRKNIKNALTDISPCLSLRELIQ